MSYVTRPRRRLAKRYRPKPALGGLIDSFQDGLVGMGLLPITASSWYRADLCAVDPGPDYDSMKAQIQTLKDTWNPTGFFTPDDIFAVQGTVLKFVDMANEQLQNAINIKLEGLPKDAFDQGLKLQAAVSTQFGEKFQPYMDAYKKARANGTRVINAPGLKGWALDTLTAALDAMFYATLLVCTTSGLEIAASAGRDILDKVSAVLLKIGGAIVDAGEAVVDAVDWTFTLLKYAKWGLLIGGSYYLYTKVVAPKLGAR